MELTVYKCLRILGPWYTIERSGQYFTLFFQDSCKALIRGFQDELQEKVKFYEVLLDFVKNKNVAKEQNQEIKKEDFDADTTSSNVTSSSVATMESQAKIREGKP